MDYDQCREILKTTDMAEIRLDLLHFSTQQVKEIFSMHTQLIATHRPGGIDEEKRKELLITAIEAGARYVDLEIEASPTFKKDIINACKKAKCQIIISYHNYEKTPLKTELDGIIDRCFADGADIAKVACQVDCEADAARILSLYDRQDNKKILALGMGEKGKITRVAAPLLGAPFTFASLSSGKETAPGQIDKKTLQDVLSFLPPAVRGALLKNRPPEPPVKLLSKQKFLGAPRRGEPIINDSDGIKCRKMDSNSLSVYRDPQHGGGRRRHIFAVTGSPVLHSKSPVIFNTIFCRLAVDATYGRIAATDAGEAVFLFKELGLTGMNVTAPFKKSIMEHLDIIDDAASKIGGVNTVALENESLKGYNTDHQGVTETLKNNGIKIEGTRFVVLGAGGAGRAAVYGLTKEKGSVTVVNRTYEKAVKIADEFNCKAEKINALELLLKNTDVLISTLSAAIDIIPAAWLPQGLVVFDANYKKSPLADKANAKGNTVIKGEEWLLNQAVPAYELFLGSEPHHQILTSGGEFESLLAAPPLEPPKNIALVGFMGSGKSFIGKILAEKLGFAFTDLDQKLEEQAGHSIPDIFEIEGEAAFRAKEKALLQSELPRYENVVYACGGGIVTDEENREILKKHSLVIWLYSSIETSLERIPPGTRPLLECEDPGKEARKILNNRLFAYALAADVMVSSEPDAKQVVEKIDEEISKTFHS
jgi:shikimate dehydrogenase/3-dehydroquinate dehydratase type I